jgi:hypothetical protein
MTVRAPGAGMPRRSWRPPASWRHHRRCLHADGFDNIETSAGAQLLTATKINAKMRQSRVVVWVEAADSGSLVTVRGAARRLATIFSSPAQESVKRAIQAIGGQ